MFYPIKVLTVPDFDLILLANQQSNIQYAVILKKEVTLYMNNFSTFKTGVGISSFGTLLPFLGLLRQLISPTGDDIVILILGTVVSLFFVLNLYLLFIAQDYNRFLKSQQSCRVIAWLFLVYPFVGFLASFYLLKATKN